MHEYEWISCCKNAWMTKRSRSSVAQSERMSSTMAVAVVIHRCTNEHLSVWMSSKNRRNTHQWRQTEWYAQENVRKQQENAGECDRRRCWWWSKREWGKEAAVIPNPYSGDQILNFIFTASLTNMNAHFSNLAAISVNLCRKLQCWTSVKAWICRHFEHFDLELHKRVFYPILTAIWVRTAISRAWIWLSLFPVKSGDLSPTYLWRTAYYGGLWAKQPEKNWVILSPAHVTLSELARWKNFE